MAANWTERRVMRLSLGLLAAISLWVVWTKTDYGFSAPDLDDGAAFASAILLLLLVLVATTATLHLTIGLLVNREPSTLAVMGALYGGVVIVWYGLANANPLLISGVTVGLLGIACLFPMRGAAGKEIRPARRGR